MVGGHSHMDISTDDNSDSFVFLCLSKRCGGHTPDRNTPLKDLDLNSLDLIEGIYELENHYGETLSNAELAKLNTVADLVRAFGTLGNRS